MTTELWYRLDRIPDLTLNRYASLEAGSVASVMKKHIAFLRQLNRKGIMSGLSFHLFYLYLHPEDREKDRPGRRLQIFLLIRGETAATGNVLALMRASPLADFFDFQTRTEGGAPPSLDNTLREQGLAPLKFQACSILTKAETLLPSGGGREELYYILREWEMNEDGRLYNLCTMMEALDHTALYRVDLYPVERAESLRETLSRPMEALRSRQDRRMADAGRDYAGRDVLDQYESLLEKYDASPHFIANIMVFSAAAEDAVSILDAAGAESLLKGKYSVSVFHGDFAPMSFLREPPAPLEDRRNGMVLRRGQPGLTVCRRETEHLKLRDLTALFSLEEIAPFFRLPALYDGERIQIPKETAPPAVDPRDALYLGKDENGYDVFFPLELLPKHAFVSGVPGSGKTNTMHHLTSSLRKREKPIPFLVFEPAKKEYRALCNDPEMEGVYLFSPNADMSFPLHINPFEIPSGTLVSDHIKLLSEVFQGAFPLEPPMPYLLETAIEAVYRTLGWLPEHLCTGREQENGRKKPLPTMSMLYRRMEEELKTTNYDADVRGNVESALKVRIGSLLRREMGDVFDVPESTFSPEKWLENSAVIELESMGRGAANFLTLLLCSLIRETLRNAPRCDGPVRHVIFIEEAHNLIGPESEERTGKDADPKQAATAFIVNMLAEVRALKESIIIADQLPSVMAPAVLKNTGLKLGLRITAEDDRSLLGGTMAATPLQLEKMATFEKGGALIFYEGLSRPFSIQIKEWWGELEDRREKAQLTESRGDAELRQTLAKDPCYLAENRRSVQIFGKKYIGRLEELRKAAKPQQTWYVRILEEQAKLNRLSERLMAFESGAAACSEKEKQRQYDQYCRLDSAWKADRKLASESLERETAHLVERAAEASFSLERMKRGRWARFPLPEKDRRDMDRLTLEFAKLGLGLHRTAVQTLGATQTLKGVEAAVHALGALRERLEPAQAE